jgi:hypothetical protein
MRRSSNSVGTLTDRKQIADPLPRVGKQRTPNPPRWHVVREIECPAFGGPPAIPFAEIFEARRSRRRLFPALLKEAVEAIVFATRSRFVMVDDNIGRRRTPSPSAGALHPIHVLLTDPRGAPRVFQVDGDSGCVRQLGVFRPGSLDQLHTQRRQIAPEADGQLLVFAADALRSDALYENAESLFWRDAGALLQSIFLSAEAHGLGFLPLGILGRPLLDAIGLDDRLLPCGAAVIGRHGL